MTLIVIFFAYCHLPIFPCINTFYKNYFWVGTYNLFIFVSFKVAKKIGNAINKFDLTVFVRINLYIMRYFSLRDNYSTRLITLLTIKINV